jgi:plastocyanin
VTTSASTVPSAPGIAPPGAVRVPAKRNAGKGGVWIVFGALGIGLLGMAPIALSGLRRDVTTLSVPAVIVQVTADDMRFTPGEIHVPAGASVQVDFANHDQIPHDFQTTNQYRDTRQVLWPGEKRTTGFIATDKPGRYTFLCTVRGHAEAGMVGTIVVEPKA